MSTTTSQQPKQPRVVKVKLEENRQVVDCLLLKEPTSAVDFRLLYSKSVPAHKARAIPAGTAIGWAKIMSNNQFIAYVNVRYQRSNSDDSGKMRDGDKSGADGDDSDSESNSDSDSDDDDDNTTKTSSKTSPDTANTATQIEQHELPHVLCTHYFKDVTLHTLIKNNNIRPPKPNAVIDPNNPPPRIPLVPSYMFAQKRLFVKWRYEIANWWSRNQIRLQAKKDKTLALFQLFQRANPEFRSIQLGKQWFFQTMTLFQSAEKAGIAVSTRLDTYAKELKFASEGLRQATDYVAPTAQRRIDQLREEANQKKQQQRLQQQQLRQQQQQDQDEFDSDDDSSSDDDSDSDDDSSSDDDASAPIVKKQPTATTTTKPLAKQSPQTTMNDDDSSSSSSDDSDDDEPPQPVSKSASKPTTQPKQLQPNRKNFDDSDSDSDSDDDEEDDKTPPPPPQPQQKKAAVAAKTTTTKKILPPAAAATITKATKPLSTQPTKRKNFDSSSSDSDSDSDSDDVKTPAPKVQHVNKRQRR